MTLVDLKFSDFKNSLILQLAAESSSVDSICWKGFKLELQRSRRASRKNRSAHPKRPSIPTSLRKRKQRVGLLVEGFKQHNRKSHERRTSHPRCEHFDKKTHLHECLRRRLDSNDPAEVRKTFQP